MKSFLSEFKEFVNRGNLLALAVAFVIGAAVTATVNALVQNVIMPIVAIPFGEVNFDSVLILTINGAEIRFGAFLTALVSFLLIALTVFWMMKAYNKVARVPNPAAEEPAALPTSAEATLLGELLEEIKGLRQDSRG
jgi:large conductance mechanosensitive channel